jgi:dCMP deaminase
MQNENQFYIDLAFNIANASYAERLKVGALIVKDSNIIAFGYNGTPAGFNNTCEVHSEDCSNEIITKPEVLHAESNAIAKCARSANSSDGATIYSTDSPCFECSKLIIQAGIIKVVFGREYRDKSGLKLLSEAGILIFNINQQIFAYDL